MFTCGGREATQARMRPPGVVEIQIPAQRQRDSDEVIRGRMKKAGDELQAIVKERNDAVARFNDRISRRVSA